MFINEELLFKNKIHYQRQLSQKKINYYLYYGSLAHLLCAPLHVISIQKQLSVPPHKDIYFDHLNIRKKEPEKLTFSNKILQIFKYPVELLMSNRENDKIKIKNILDKLDKNTDKLNLEKLPKQDLNLTQNSANNEQIKVDEIKLKDKNELSQNQSQGKNKFIFKTRENNTTNNKNTISDNKIKSDVNISNSNNNHNISTNQKSNTTSTSNNLINKFFDKIIYRKSKDIVPFNNSNLSIDENNQLTEKIFSKRDKINRNLIELSGVPEGQQPYRAPIYDTYSQMFKSFNKQGILSFWKGTVYRICFFGFSWGYSPSIYWFGFEQLADKGLVKRAFPIDDFANISLMAASLSVLDCFANGLFMIENRYVLQNRLHQFRVYQSLFTVISRMYYEILNYSLPHLAKNFVFCYTFYASNYLFKTFNFDKYISNLITENIPLSHIEISYLLATLLAYPIQTVHRRLVCQNTNYPGLLPIRYINLVHGLFLIRREEGIISGLYKGVTPFMIAQYIIFCKVIPLAGALADVEMKKDFSFIDSDEYYDSLQKRRFER
jgi:hypothetical protein